VDAANDGVYYFLEGNCPAGLTTEKALEYFGDLTGLLRIHNLFESQFFVFVEEGKLKANLFIKRK